MKKLSQELANETQQRHEEIANLSCKLDIGAASIRAQIVEARSDFKRLNNDLGSERQVSTESRDSIKLTSHGKGQKLVSKLELKDRGGEAYSRARADFSSALHDFDTRLRAIGARCSMLEAHSEASDGTVVEARVSPVVNPSIFAEVTVEYRALF